MRTGWQRRQGIASAKRSYANGYIPIGRPGFPEGHCYLRGRRDRDRACDVVSEEASKDGLRITNNADAACRGAGVGGITTTRKNRKGLDHGQFLYRAGSHDPQWRM